MKAQIKALKLAIKALTSERRRLYAAGESAFQKGIDFMFAIHAHVHYEEHSQAIQQLEDMIEILTDPGATVEPEELQ